MIPEIGHFALIIALALAIVQSILPIIGSYRNESAWVALARPAAFAQALFVSIAFAILIFSFVTNDFTVLYVASNSNSTLPWYYRIAGTWGGHEGSLLLWTEMLGLWTVAVALFSRQLPEITLARVIAVMGLISIGFLSFMILTSNPFDRLLPGAIDGRDLNPLLQDFGMIMHPPMLYMGYVGFSVAFSFAIAALMGGQLDATWARWSRPWTLVAWLSLTLGIFMGSFWAYYELGWGGWWFWDAVENASFMPWLVGTALIHSLAVTEKRGSFKNWTVLLAIIAFSLSLLGTFLVRSGVLTSVHAFASDPKRGSFILVFLGLVVGGSLTLYAWRAPKVGLGGRFAVFSRESMLLLNNVLLLVASATVFLGTLYPLFLDALGLGKISVGPPYFEAVFVPLMLPILLVMGLGPFVRWKDSSIRHLVAKLRWLLLGVMLFSLCFWLVSRFSMMVMMGLILAWWITALTAIHVFDRLAQTPTNMTWQRKLSSQTMSYWGMIIAHLGVAVFVIGVTMVKGLDISNDVQMRIGDVASAGDYEFKFLDIREIKGPNYIASQGRFLVTHQGRRIALLKPEKRVYTVQQMPMTEASINRGITRDLYVSLGESVDQQTWMVRVQYKPFVGWIWAGCLIIALGGLFAAADRRYRLVKKRHIDNSVLNLSSHEPVEVIQS